MNAFVLHIKPLTSLRAFAALWVILFTSWSLMLPQGMGELPGLIKAGNLGVDLFFILSGFILCHVYLDEFGQKRFSYREFLTHRLARIYPLHLATLWLTIMMGSAALMFGAKIDSDAMDWSSLPANLFMVHAWGLAPSAAFNHPSWSISAEWFAYLCFPLFASVAWTLRKKPVVAFVLGLVSLSVVSCAFWMLTGKELTNMTIDWGALRILPTFFLGSMLYVAYRSGVVSNRLIASAGFAISASFVALCAHFNMPAVLIITALGLCVISLAGIDPMGKGILSSKPLVYLGEISFAAYMVYVPVKWVYVKAFERLVGGAGAAMPVEIFSFMIVVIFVVAALAHHIIELPMRKFVREVAAKQKVNSTQT
jgi:peptidoglycan/LPS O-acetylase OafA/YrhL